jgi:hypothetical protein
MLCVVVCLVECGTDKGDECCTSRLALERERRLKLSSSIGLSAGDCSKCSSASDGNTGNGVAYKS